MMGIAIEVDKRSKAEMSMLFLREGEKLVVILTKIVLYSQGGVV